MVGKHAYKRLSVDTKKKKNKFGYLCKFFKKKEDL